MSLTSLRGRLLGLVAAAVLTGSLVGAPSALATTSTSYAGVTSDGGGWVADVPSPWNGTLLLYSHGFGTLSPQDAPDDATKQALLDRRYALVGSGYDPAGSLWALGSAVRDQFEAAAAVRAHLPTDPRHLIAFGTSMGGLVSTLENEPNDYGAVDGALTTCGIVAGGIQLGNYQLDGEYAMSRLLAPGVPIKLVGYVTPAEGLAAGKQLDAVAQQAQQTPEGRARLALAMALMNVSPWAPGQPMPDRRDFAAQEAGEYDVQFGGAFTTMDFVELGRYSIEQAAGGNPAWTAGVDFSQLYKHSPYASQVRALYAEAGLDLRADLESLTAGADIAADPGAVAWMQRTSVPTGELRSPQLDLHTISDQLVPVQQERYFGDTVNRAGAGSLLRQAYVERQQHCNFTPAELVAGVLAVEQRIETGAWRDVAQPAALQASALSLGLGDAAFVRYRPDPLSGDNGPYGG